MALLLLGAQPPREGRTATGSWHSPTLGRPTMPTCRQVQLLCSSVSPGMQCDLAKPALDQAQAQMPQQPGMCSMRPAHQTHGALNELERIIDLLTFKLLLKRPSRGFSLTCHGSNWVHGVTGSRYHSMIVGKLRVM